MQKAAEGEAEFGRFQLPVSRRLVLLRQPRGAEDLLIAETARTASGDATLALTLAERLSAPVEGEALDWPNLPVTDLDTLVLRLRQALLGDRIWTDLACPSPGCGQRIDIEFGIEEFLAHHAPRSDRARVVVERDTEPGWYRLSLSSDSAAEADTVRFRLPTVSDQIAVVGSPEPSKALARRCIRPGDLPARLRRRVESAMEALSPSLSNDLQGSCPECGSKVTMFFDARWFCLRELRERALLTYQDVDLLARRYHWSETEILALPRSRRSAYAELARQAEGA